MELQSAMLGSQGQAGWEVGEDNMDGSGHRGRLKREK